LTLYPNYSPLLVDLLFPKIAEGSVREWAFRFQKSFFIKGYVDTVVSCQHPLPLPLSDPTQIMMTKEHLNELRISEQSLEEKILEKKWPPKQGTFRGAQRNSVPPIPLSPYLYKTKSTPFLNVLIDNKAESQELNRSQMILYLYASLASQARYRNVTSSASAIGIVSDGYRWCFIVFQLNTLDLDNPEVKNIVWTKEERLYDQTTSTLSLTPYKLLTNIAATAVASVDVQSLLQ